MQLIKGTELKRGDYQIIEVLGQGGFGITYLAYQTALGRKVAIKEFFMKEHCNRESDSKSVSVPSTGSKGLVEYFKKKFLKEALLIASFNNARIIRIYDVFEENGTAYYVMEYLEGESLKEVVDNNGALPEDVAVKYIRQAAEALSAVHAHNLLHLDVKPANIMLDENCNAVLIDFGVSKHYDEKGAQTSSAGVGLSEGYAPLEQYEAGSLKEFTPATDIYALGATLFFLLTGTRPPKASIVNDSGLPPMPTAISAPVRKAVEKAMQPRRKDRPQSIEEFVELLDAPKPKLPTRKFPWIVVLLLLAVGAVAGGFMLLGGGNVITDSVVDSVNNNYIKESYLFKTEINEPYTVKNDDVVLYPMKDKSSKWGYIDKNGKVVIPFKYDGASPFRDDLAYIKIGSKDSYKYGFVDKNGNLVVECKYDNAWPMQYGYARVKLNGKYGLVDKNGREIVPCKYDDLYFDYMVAHVRSNDRWGVINQNGEVILPCKYEGVRSHKGDVVGARLQNKWGFVDKNSNIIIPFKYDELGYSHEDFISVKYDGKWGFVDNKGHEVVPCKYEEVGLQTEEMSSVRLNGKWGFVDNNGYEIISCKYDRVTDFSEGVANVTLDGKVYTLDKAGNKVASHEYDYVFTFRHGYAYVVKGDKHGFINKSFEKIVSCKYDDVSSFHKGYACVGMGEYGNCKYGVIDSLGKEIVPCRYDEIDIYSDWPLVVELNGRYGFVDRTGSEIIPCKYDDMYNYDGELAEVELKGEHFYIDKVTGKRVGDKWRE